MKLYDRIINDIAKAVVALTPTPEPIVFPEFPEIVIPEYPDLTPLRDGLEAIHLRLSAIEVLSNDVNERISAIDIIMADMAEKVSAPVEKTIEKTIEQRTIEVDSVTKEPLVHVHKWGRFKQWVVNGEIVSAQRCVECQAINEI